MREQREREQERLLRVEASHFRLATVCASVPVRGLSVLSKGGNYGVERIGWNESSVKGAEFRERPRHRHGQTAARQHRGREGRETHA